MPIDPRQYNSAAAFIEDDPERWSKLVGNLSNPDDVLRIKSYELHEDMYRNNPEHIGVTLRGEDDDSVEIYLPSAKKCIEAVNRFLAVDFDYAFDVEGIPDEEQPDNAKETSVTAAMDLLFKKQDVRIKFNNLKRYMLIKGDALLHVRALPWQRSGQRIQIDELKPEHYFPIENLVTGNNLGCHIVDVIRNPRNSARTKGESDEWIVRRQTYEYILDPETNLPKPNPIEADGTGGGVITSRLALYKVGRWDDRMADAEIYEIEEVEPERPLPAQIDQIPVYHWKNKPPPNSTFGMSELSGVESIINAINQAATDEDLTLITQGLGVYWSDASPPTDDNGDEVPWEVGPGSVVQVGAGGKFGRVTGVSSVAPYHEHIKMLDEAMQQGIGVPDVAIGMVDTSQVESGIALQLKFGPLLANCKEIEMLVVDATDAFLEDLLKWIKVYENVDTDGIQPSTVFGDPMPKNKAEDLKNVLDIWTQCAGALPISWLYEQLNDIMGYELDENTDFDAAIEDAKRIAESSMPADPFGAGMGDENADGFGGGSGTGGLPPEGSPPLNGSKTEFSFA